MIGMRTILEVADNSGARRLAVHSAARRRPRAARRAWATSSRPAVKEAAPDSAIKKGKVVRCVIVRMRKETRRKDGTYIRFDSNAAVLVNEVGRAGGHARVRAGGARAARQEIHEDRFACPGGDLDGELQKKQSRPSRSRIEFKKERHGESDHRPRQGQDRARARGRPRDRAACWWKT